MNGGGAVRVKERACLVGAAIDSWHWMLHVPSLAWSSSGLATHPALHDACLLCTWVTSACPTPPALHVPVGVKGKHVQVAVKPKRVQVGVKPKHVQVGVKPKHALHS